MKSRFMEGWTAARLRDRALAFLHRYDQTKLLMSVFYGLVAGVAITLALDYRELAEANAYAELTDPAREPMIPGLTKDGEPLPNEVETSYEDLRRQLTIALGPGGALELTGTIQPGAAARFDEEIGKVGEYVTRVRLDSPGGSVPDALAIGRAIRARGYATLVEKGGFCASSCPLVFAGGVSRQAEDGATLGVHQVFSPGETGETAASAMAGAQSTTARIQRYLAEMDVDPVLWTHAMETPPHRLYYLSPDEMAAMRLTGGTEVAEAE
jgi:hypothetical protein